MVAACRRSVSPAGCRARSASIASSLLTGFEPFGGETVNVSLQVVRRLHGWRSPSGAPVTACEIPTEFGRALDVLADAIESTRPELVIALGQAASRGEISVERIAINVDDARIPDNAGRQPIDEPVIAGGPAGYFSTLPIKAIVAALHQANIAAAVSQSAGTFVCNHLFYGLAHLIATRWPDMRGGFIHLPLLPEQTLRFAGAQGLPLDTMIEAVRIAIDTSLSGRIDETLAAGAID
jgi:pyroglutamyl-peptidase